MYFFVYIPIPRMERERVRTFVKSQSTSRVPSTYQQPEPTIKKQQQLALPTRPPPPKLAPLTRPQLPQQEKPRQSRPPPPP